jgi:hypothetical protein
MRFFVDVVMAITLGVALAAATWQVSAQSFSSTDEDGKLTITKEPCTAAGPWFAKWRAATWVYRGKHYDACWSVVRTTAGGQTIVVIDSDGQVSNINPARFAPESGV